MNTYTCRKTFSLIALGTALAALLLPNAVLAEPPSTAACDGLVSVANNLYLVSTGGKVLTQFTANGTPKLAAALSPDGSRVAYVEPGLGAQIAQTYEVVNRYHQQGSYPIYKMPKRDDPYGFVAESVFEELVWSSGRVLTLITTRGKDGVFWLFRQIPDDLSPDAPLVARPPMEDHCALAADSRRVACLDTGGSVYLGGGSISGRSIFSVTGFEGIKPEESFTLGVGESVITRGTDPKYMVTLKTIDRNAITLRVTPPNGLWQEATIKNNEFVTNPYVWDTTEYGFFIHVINRRAFLVRVDVIRSDSPWNIFDPALTWTPSGRGILIIRHTNAQAFLYLIRPDDGQRESNQRDHGQWTLAAQAPVQLPGEIDFMRFATPDLLLLKDHFGHYYKLPIQIASNHGTETLTLGQSISLPTKLAVRINHATVQGTVMDWSCGNQPGIGNGGLN